MQQSIVHVRDTTVRLPTYELFKPDTHPMFLEKRVYQGSSGKVYPLPFFDRVADHPVDREWRAIYLENDYIELMILPEIGGRIHAGRDKINGYDFFYRQNVIKPALVGLAGPWISGGMEFNWPQHHRPSTYMPAEVAIEESADGSKTVWLSEHDPLCRMKGMHGVTLHPGKALVEVKVRIYNRTSLTQTFLWWANVGVRVHEGYQSFFPPDVTHVADHAKRAVACYPLCEGTYYGVNYGRRAKEGVPKAEIPTQFIPPHLAKETAASPVPSYAPNDLSWYANIPVPTSYMCMSSEKDFFGGYDHFQDAGLVHVANRHIAPGKKQWTWGNHEFGYAWDRNLTDKDGPYIELMAGVFTDNQPDFSFLGPGETKTWSQFWYPLRGTGPVIEANKEAALSLKIEKGIARICIGVTGRLTGATVRLLRSGNIVDSWTGDLAPEQTWTRSIHLPKNIKPSALKIVIAFQDGRELLAYQPIQSKRSELPKAATEPARPRDVQTSEELYLIGLHLEQYRHATRNPEPYWREALRRDPGDARSNNALGLWHLRRGEFSQAERHFQRAVARVTDRNPNPYDGEPCYNLGLTLRYLGRDDEAYAAFYKATWNQAWQGAAFHCLAEIDCCRRDYEAASEHLDQSLRMNTGNLRTRNLLALVLRATEREIEAENLLSETLKLDPLDQWARLLLGAQSTGDTQAKLDLALDFSRAGFFSEAIMLLEKTGRPTPGTAPLLAYYLAWLHKKVGDSAAAKRWLKTAGRVAPDHCFPARLEEIEILETAVRLNPTDARAYYYLANLLYDKKRHREAISLWETSVKLDPTYSVAWRNLGIGYFNINRQPAKARASYEKAFNLNSSEPRLLYERDQLWKRLGESPSRRLKELKKYRDLVDKRDDLTLEMCALYCQMGQPAEALKIVTVRKFQPWEGGEGLALGQHVRAHVLLAHQARRKGDFALARNHLEKALSSPGNLGEARHLLVNQSDIHYYLGQVYADLADKTRAHEHWNEAAGFQGDFQGMTVKTFSEMTYFSALALRSLGRKSSARRLLSQLLAYARKLEKAEAEIDYFATSLPTMLLFDEDIQFQQQTQALFLQAQANLGLGQSRSAKELVRHVLKRDPNHPLAADLENNLTNPNRI